MPDETDNKSDINKQTEKSQSQTPTPKPKPQEELKQEAKQTIEEPAAKKPDVEVPKPVEEVKPKRRYGKAAEPAADETKPGMRKGALKIDESVVDRKSLLKPPNRDAKPKAKPKEEPKEEPMKLKGSLQPKDGDKTKLSALKKPEPKTVETTKDIIMEDASVVPIPDPERRPSLRNKYDPMKFVPSVDVEAGIVESNLETIDDAQDDAEVNTKHLYTPQTHKKLFEILC